MNRYTTRSGPADSISGIDMNRLCMGLEEDEIFILEEAIKKLGHYEDLYEQGRLIETSIAIGKTVYCILPNETGGYHIEECNVDGLTTDVCDPEITYSASYSSLSEEIHFTDGCIGETIFRSKIEARAELKEMEADNAENYETK